MSEMPVVAMYTFFFQTCNSDTREDAKIYMTVFYKSCIGMECRSSRPVLEDFSHPASVLLHESLCASLS